MFSTEWQLQRTQDKSVSLFNHLVCDKDMKADRDGVRLPDGLDQQSVFIFLGDSVPGGRQNYKVKARFTGKRSKY